MFICIYVSPFEKYILTFLAIYICGYFSYYCSDISDLYMFWTHVLIWIYLLKMHASDFCLFCFLMFFKEQAFYLDKVQFIIFFNLPLMIIFSYPNDLLSQGFILFSVFHRSFVVIFCFRSVIHFESIFNLKWDSTLYSIGRYNLSVWYM